MARIFVIDEDQDSLNFINSSLPNDYQIITETDPFDAIELANIYSFDLIITELNISKINGFKLIQSLKRSKKNKNTRLVLFSSRNDQRDIKKAIEIGINSYIIKPITMKDFKIRLQEILDASSSCKEPYFFLPSSDQLANAQASLSQSVQIKKISEISVTFTSSFKIGDVGTVIQLKSHFFSLIGFDIVHGKVSSIQKLDSKKWNTEVHYLRPRDQFVQKVKEKIYASVI